MWGFGGKYYWGRKETMGKVEGIVVVFAWMSSEEKHVKNYVDLYSSLGWNSLVCHSQFLNLFFPDKAASLALEVIGELLKELKIRPRPVVFASFSGGPKALMYKLLQIIEGQCQDQEFMADYKLVRDCVSAFIFDSTPVDFTSDLGTRFVLHPSVLKTSRPPLIVSWIANCISSTLDAVFLSRFESERAEYWQTLYSTVNMRAPYLILCSVNDDLAPYRIIYNFSQRLQELGADVQLVKWETSSHVGHYKHYPSEYKAAVSDLLVKASLNYSQRISQLEGEKTNLDCGTNGVNTHPINDRRNAGGICSLESFKKTSELGFKGNIDRNSHRFVVPSSLECLEDSDVGTLQDEFRQDYSTSASRETRLNVQGVVGRFLFDDDCVPKDVEDWDVRLSSFTRGTGRHCSSSFNPMKRIRRSRL